MTGRAIVRRPGEPRRIDLGSFDVLDELAAAMTAGMSDQGLDAIADRSAMEVVGPAPEGYL